MSRAVNAVVVGLAAFVIMAGTIWYFVVVRSTNEIEASITGGRWQPAGSETLRLESEVTFRNGLDVDAQLVQIRYGFVLEGQILAENRTLRADPIPAGTRLTVPLTIDVATDWVSEWFRVHVEQGEESRAGLEGEALFRVADRDRTVSINGLRKTETHIADSIGALFNCPQPVPQPCIESARAQWMRVEDLTGLRVVLALHNDLGDNVIASNRSGDLQLGNVSVAGGNVSGDFLISPHARADMDFTLFLDAAQLARWWPQHALACEASDATLIASFDLRTTPGSEPPTTTPPSTSPPPEPPPSPTPTTSPTPEPEPSPSPSPSPSPTPTTSNGSAEPTQSPPPSNNSTSAPPANGPAQEERVFERQDATAAGRPTWILPLERFETLLGCRP